MASTGTYLSSYVKEGGLSPLSSCERGAIAYTLVLHTPDVKGILVTVNYGKIQSACMEYNKCYNSRLESLFTPRFKIKHSTTQKALLHCHINYKTH